MKKLILLAMAIFAAISPSLCSAQDIFPKEIINRKGVKLVKFSPWILKVGLKSQEEKLKSQGIEELTDFEVISADPWAFYGNPDKTLYSTLVTDIERSVKDMKLENVMEVRDGDEKIDLWVNQVAGQDSMIDTFIIKIEKSQEVTVLGMKGKINLSKLIEKNAFIKYGRFKIDGLMNIQ